MMKKERIDELLGAGVRFRVKLGRSPWEFYRLLDSLKARIQPENWTIRRLIGFRCRTWKLLQKLAMATGRGGGTRLSPAEIAAVLIEEILGRTCAR